MKEMRELKSVADVLSLICDAEGDLTSTEVINSVAFLMESHNERTACIATAFLVELCGEDGRRKVKEKLLVNLPNKDLIKGIVGILGYILDEESHIVCPNCETIIDKASPCGEIGKRARFKP